MGFYQFRGGQTIIFTETKDSASELSGLLPGARALHGDIQQSQREVKCSVSFFLFFELNEPEGSQPFPLYLDPHCGINTVYMVKL